MNSHESSMGASTASQCERAPQASVGNGGQAIKFRAGRFVVGIERVQIERETSKSVWVRRWTFKGAGTGEPRKHAKRSEYDNYFDSWHEAHQFLLGQANLNVLEAREELKRAHDRLGNVKGMKEPK